MGKWKRATTPKDEGPSGVRPGRRGMRSTCPCCSEDLDRRERKDQRCDLCGWERDPCPRCGRDRGLEPRQDPSWEVGTCCWPELGLRPYRGDDGLRPTHVLGDEYAEAVVSGEVPFEDARRREEERQRSSGARRRRRILWGNRR